MTASIHQQMLDKCISLSGLWAVVVSTNRDGVASIICSGSASLTPAAAQLRAKAGVDHWRVWVPNEIDARAVSRYANERLRGCDRREDVIEAVRESARKVIVCAWTDQQILAQAEYVATAARLALSQRRQQARASGKTRKNELFLTLRALIPQQFYKPLFALHKM